MIGYKILQFPIQKQANGFFSLLSFTVKTKILRLLQVLFHPYTDAIYFAIANGRTEKLFFPEVGALRCIESEQLKILV